MAKKKKTQLKPVARGFATTSLPKKVIPEDVPASEPLSVEISAGRANADGDGHGTPPVQSGDEKQTSRIISPEESNLQNLVDRFQDKTEKEVSR